MAYSVSIAPLAASAPHGHLKAPELALKLL